MKKKQKRVYSRFLIDLPMTFSVLGGRVFDDKSRVHDLTPEGFGFETSHPLETGARIAFSVELDYGEHISGQAKVVWSRHVPQQGTWAGAHITQLSWRDRRRIKKLVLPPGYDWDAFFDRLLIASFVVALVLLVEDLARHHQDLLKIALGLWPEIMASLAVIVSMRWFLKNRRRR